MFRQYSVREGEELALVCRDTNNRNNANIGWRRKVGNISYNHQKGYIKTVISNANQYRQCEVAWHYQFVSIRQRKPQNPPDRIPK